jgi:hypothetical protein
VRIDKLRNLNFSPTRAMVDERLRAEAVKLGADAVIQVRYSNVGVTLTSWVPSTERAAPLSLISRKVDNPAPGLCATVWSPTGAPRRGGR